MKPFNIVLLAFFVILIIVTSHWLGQQSYTWLPVPAALEAEPVGDLFSFLVTLGSVIFLGVLGIMLYCLVVYRVAKDDHSDAPAIRGNTKLEITWTIIPIFLVIWITVYSYDIYERMNVLGHLSVVQHHGPLDEPAYAAEPKTLSGPTETIEVIAKQWSWTFHYPNHKVTSSELHLPVNQRVQLKLQSTDVLHGFYVPNFRIKQDIVPNRTIDLSLTPNRIGKYQLEDSQFSGTYFSLMKADVYIDSSEGFKQWLKLMSNQVRKPAKNDAFSEYSQPKQTKFDWPSVTPATPPLVQSSW